MSAATPDAKPRLNVPPSMAGALRLDPSSSSRPRLMNNEAPKTPSPSKATTYSDRFIPCRTSSRLHNFHLLGSPGSKDSDTPYSRLLRAELFGAPDSPGGRAASSTTPASPNNLFRFKKDHSPAASTAKSQLDFSSLGPAGEVPSPQKKPRKVPKTPHKVLDAPSLLDDFYLNLVDWSSQNMLAVGLGTCVYLWSASNSKVTKLCDLGPRDSVCAVHWSREGSYLSIGTGLGDVQVYSSFSSPIILSNCHLLLLDKMSAIALSKNPVLHGRSKHIKTKYNFILECVDNDEVVLESVGTVDQLADILTKPLARVCFQELREKIGVVKIMPAKPMK